MCPRAYTVSPHVYMRTVPSVGGANVFFLASERVVEAHAVRRTDRELATGNPPSPRLWRASPDEGGAQRPARTAPSGAAAGYPTWTSAPETSQATSTSGEAAPLTGGTVRRDPCGGPAQLASQAIPVALEAHRDVAVNRRSMLGDPGHHLLHGGRKRLRVRRIPGQCADAAHEGTHRLHQTAIWRVRHRQRQGGCSVAELCHTRGFYSEKRS